MIKNVKGIILALVVGFAVNARIARAQGQGTNQVDNWFSQPLSLEGAINLALKQNGTILRGKSDLEAQYGLVVQTRAIAIPKVQATGNYQYSTEVEAIPFGGIQPVYHTWAVNVQVVQTIYQGGQVTSALRSAKLTKEQALLQYQTVVADSLLQVRIGYYDVLQTMEQVEVEEASVKLLAQQLEDQQRRLDAGTVPKFNVLQAEVAHANEKPKLIQARNQFRIAKNNLVNLLGVHLPPQVLEDVPLQLTDKLDSDPYQVELPVAISRAFQNRSEIAALRKAQDLASEAVISAKSTYKPSAQIFAGYGARNEQFLSSDPGQEIHGVNAGAQVSWNIFDGFLTKGKVEQATALSRGSRVDLDNELRGVELEVRTDFSNFIEARETLESQKKVQEEAEEALRLARARNDAGSGTQLDVLAAQTSLTQARSTQVQALHDYDVTRARLERAMGINIMQSLPK